jgi:hypothetical protein
MVVVSAVAAVIAMSWVSLARAGAPHTADVTVLFDRAIDKARSERDFARATMLEVDGLPAGKGPVRKAAQIVSWRFVLDNQGTKDSPFDSAALVHRRSSGFGEVVGHKGPFLEDREIKHAPKLTFPAAVSLLQDSGYRGGFFNVTLRSPIGPQKVAPLYIFSTGDGYISVNTKTRRVAPIP